MTTPLLLSLLLACTDTDGDGFRNGRDCSSLDASIYPAAEEVCDGQDNDCDGFIDEGVSISAWLDRDGDGFGDDLAASRVCALPANGATQGGDCDDRDASALPEGAEICDGVDNDCDGEVDEGVDRLYYADLDGDGVGGEETVRACFAPQGYAAAAEDCDDTDASVFPGAVERCDTLDNDCDGEIDEDPWLEPAWADADGDGAGDPTSMRLSCGDTPGYVWNSLDCDDTDPSRGPYAAELREDLLDNDCDGFVDEWAISGDFSDLEDAMALATTGDVLQLGPGTFRGTLDMRGKNITLAGSGCAETLLYGDGLGSVLWMDQGSVQGLTLGGGSGEIGGGLRVEGDVRASEICAVGNRASAQGGGIAVVSGTLRLTDAILRANRANGAGGGLYVGPGAALEATRLGVLSNRAATDGGGLAIAGGQAVLTNSWWAGNEAAKDAGAIAIYDKDGHYPSMNAQFATFAGNRSSRRAQGILNLHGTVALDHLVAVDHDGTFLYDLYAESAVTHAGIWQVEPEYSAGWFVNATRGAPQFVSWSPERAPETWDFRLRERSSFADQGDPSILDEDATPADLGAFGGPQATAGAAAYSRRDTDGDGLVDGWEREHDLNLWVADGPSDEDGDSLSLAEEVRLGCDPRAADSDSDGALDGAAGERCDAPWDHAPTAVVGRDRWTVLGDEVLLSGTDSWDPDGASLTYLWSMDAPSWSSAATLTGTNGPEVVLQPDVAGTYVLTLAVSDGHLTRTDALTVEVVEAVRVPEDAATLDEARALAGGALWIALEPGEYELTWDLGGRPLRLLGLGAPDEARLFGEGPRITALEGEEVRLAQLTLVGGQAAEGGVIHAKDAQLYLDQVVVEGGRAAQRGGAISQKGGTLSTRSVDFWGAEAADAGGALSLIDVTWAGEDLRFGGTYAGHRGGALYLDGGASELQRVSTQRCEAGEGSVLFSTGRGPVRWTQGWTVASGSAPAVVGANVEWLNSAVIDSPAPLGAGPMALYLGVDSTFSAETGEQYRGALLPAQPRVARWTRDLAWTDDLWALLPDSAWRDAGLPWHTDPDGSPADLGPCGGAGAPTACGRFSQDADDDGLSDGWERLVGLDPSAQDGDIDADGDGLSTAEEYALGGDPALADTDGDGLSDGEEGAASTDPADPSDHRPVAVLAPPAPASAGEITRLDASASYDPDGAPLRYAWSLLEAPAASILTPGLLDEAGARFDFAPDVRGEYRLSLTVSDGEAVSLPLLIRLGVAGDLRVPEQWPTLDAALADVREGDTIRLGPGVHSVAYTGTGVSFSIIGSAGAAIRPPIGSPALTLTLGEAVALENLTVEGALSRYGAILCRVSTLALRQVTLADNTGYHGGALNLEGCTATLIETELSHNAARYNGGAVYQAGGTLSWRGGGGDHNVAGAVGGLLYSYQGQLDLSNLVFTENTSESYAAVLALSGTGLVADHLSLANNKGSYGDIYLSSSTGALTHTVFAAPQAFGVYSTTSASFRGAYNACWRCPSGLSSRGDGLDVITEDPLFLSWSGVPDLRLGRASPLRDAGDPATEDPDGSRADVGAFGGAGAAEGWDLGWQDADGDGLADLWEREHGLLVGSPDAGDDPDGDGLSNAEELALGTAPSADDTDGDGLSDGTDAAPLTPSNLPPEADAGDDLAVRVDDAAPLDGRGSVDPEGQPLQYSWRLEAVPGRSRWEVGAVIGSTPTAELVPDSPGLFLVSLVVSDGVRSSTQAWVEVRAGGTLEVPADYADLEEAAWAAVPSATLSVAEGVWPCNVDLAGKDLTVVGDGAGLTVLDGGDSRIFEADEGEWLTLRDLRLTGGSAAFGGAIWVEGGGLVTEEVALTDNSAVDGGAIFLSLAEWEGDRVRLTENYATWYGGAVYAELSSIQLSQLFAAGNRSEGRYGGALYLTSGELEVDQAIFAQNEAVDGGAIYATGTSSSPSTVTLSQATATGNIASNLGSLARLTYSTFNLRNSIIAYHPRGGAVQAASTGTTLAVSHTLTWDNLPSSWAGLSGFAPGAGWIEAAPLFSGYTGAWADDDWRLGAGSPAVDAGDPSSPADEDGTAPDLGAYGGPNGPWELR